MFLRNAEFMKNDLKVSMPDEIFARMEAAGAATVRALDEPRIDKLAERLWVVPPGGSLL